MLAAVAATVRQLKNKETNVDMYVPSFVERPGSLLTSTTYSVVVVSSLPAFKTKSHTFKDNVQFVVQKNYSDFENLRSQLDSKYSATILPTLPKRMLLLAGDKVTATERLAACDRLMRAIASNPKLCTCSIVLSFLGITLMGTSREKDEEEATLDMDDVTLPGSDASKDSADVSHQPSAVHSFLDENQADVNLFSLDEEEEKHHTMDKGEHSDEVRPGLPVSGRTDLSAVQMFARLDLEEGNSSSYSSDHVTATVHSVLSDDDDSSELLGVNYIDDLIARVQKKTPQNPTGAPTSYLHAGSAGKRTAASSDDTGGSAIDETSVSSTDVGLKSMASDDILRYIAEHSAGNEQDDNLFS